jgi:hypothetical protein
MVNVYGFKPSWAYLGQETRRFGILSQAMDRKLFEYWRQRV